MVGKTWSAMKGTIGLQKLEHVIFMLSNVSNRFTSDLI